MADSAGGRRWTAAAAWVVFARFHFDQHVTVDLELARTRGIRLSN